MGRMGKHITRQIIERNALWELWVGNYDCFLLGFLIKFA